MPPVGPAAGFPGPGSCRSAGWRTRGSARQREEGFGGRGGSFLSFYAWTSPVPGIEPGFKQAVVLLIARRQGGYGKPRRPRAEASAL